MKLWFADFETFYNDEYSLRKMTPAEYILDPRYETIGCAFKEGLAGQPFWIEGPKLQRFFDDLPREVCVVSHNALFDACIMAWRYGYIPKLSSCTLSIARATIGHRLTSLSLEAVAKHLELGEKGRAIMKVKGFRLEDLRIRPELYLEFMGYALNDVTFCAGIFDRLVVQGGFPRQELAVLDMVIRCATQPVFQLDRDILRTHLTKVQGAKTAAILAAGTDKLSLMSNDRFAEVLKHLGVVPPRKISTATGKENWAFAKTDLAFLDLLEHENPLVQALAAARMGVKTTIEETRTIRFLKISELRLPGRDHELLGMPMPIRYAGAHTHRFSGDWKLNVQNLTRGGELRRSLRAPAGYKVVTVDAAQIEARLTAWFAGCQDLTNQFGRGEDVYSNFASKLFEKPVDKSNKVERFIGKTGILSLGFGAGWEKFKNTLAVLSEAQFGSRITYTDYDAQKVIDTYRSQYNEIPKLWRMLDNTVIPLLAGREDKLKETKMPLTINPIEIHVGKIVLPGLDGKIGKGLSLVYENLTEDPTTGWEFTYAGKKKKLYGGKLLENVIQALDRVIVVGAALRCQKILSPYRLQQQAHDENAYVVREEHVEPVKTIVLHEMLKIPSWAYGLPLAAEAGIGDSYGDAK